MGQGSTFTLWAALGAVVGCASDGSSSGPSQGRPVDISGVYAVTHHTRNPSNCGVEGADVSTYTHFQAIATSDSGYAVVECGSADPASCPTRTDTAFFDQLIAAFDTPEVDGWSLEFAWASDLPPCHLTFVATQVVLTGEELHIEVRVYAEDTNLVRPDCSVELAAERNTSMPCDEFVVVAGTRL